MADWKWIMRYIIIKLLSIMMGSLFGVYILIMRLIKGKQFLEIKPRPTPPAIISDSKWGNHSYMNLKSQGIKLHYVEKGDRTKPLIVFIHGFPECWFSWRSQMEHLSENYWVVAVDMRGYGDSDRPSKTSAYDVKYLVEDMRQFILALGKEKCTVMAHDWGAVVAWELIIKHPELFNHHISCNGPHPAAFKKVIDSSWKQKCMSWYMIFFQLPWIPELLIGANDLASFDKGFGGKKPSPEITEAYKYYYSKKGALTGPINYYRCKDFGANREKMPKVTVPTLIIWGTEDQALSKEMATLGVEECEKCVLKFIEGASHFVQQDKSELVNQYVLEYLAGELS